MNRKLFAVLKPGGYLVIADHSALSGQRTSVGKTLHRIEESALGRKSKQPASAWSLNAILAKPKRQRDFRVSGLQCRSTISCSSSKSR